MCFRNHKTRNTLSEGESGSNLKAGELSAGRPWGAVTTLSKWGLQRRP